MPEEEDDDEDFHLTPEQFWGIDEAEASLSRGQYLTSDQMSEQLQTLFDKWKSTGPHR